MKFWLPMGKVGQTVQLQIESISKKGHGLGEIDTPGGKSPVEVPNSMPGDRVEVQLLRRRRGCHRSRLLAIVSPSPNRIQPKCSHFGLCGGCQWQHIAYEQQLSYKREEIAKAFTPFCNTIPTPLPSDRVWGYRNKMEFTFSTNAAGTRYLGLIIGGSRGYVFNLEECPLVDGWFSDVVSKVRQWWEEEDIPSFHLHKGTGALRYITLRKTQNTNECQVTLTVTKGSLTEEQKRSFVEAIQAVSGDRPLSCVLKEQCSAKGVATTFEETVLFGPAAIKEKLTIDGQELTFSISSSAFFQPNTSQAEKLYSLAIKEAGITKKTVVYDLYCGTGTFALCAAPFADQVFGIELVPDAVEDAKANAGANGLDNVHFIAGDVGQKLAGLQAPKPDVVIVDPPRAGLDKPAIEALKGTQVPKIVYVSCNYKTQAENIQELVEAGYRVDKVIPVDQFPHTVHVENIAILSKS